MQYFFTFIISGLAHFFQHISSCLTIRFDNTSMTSLVFSVKIYRSINYTYIFLKGNGLYRAKF